MTGQAIVRCTAGDSFAAGLGDVDQARTKNA